ncbi:MAG: YitT family protein [Oscillospiraceae bacterium]|nr:YitT family protein [Oscillospiraceae bacterium]
MRTENLVKKTAVALLGSGILAFGLYHIHSVSGVTEGGVLGATLLLQHWLAVSPAVSGFLMNLACYALGWRTLGRPFLYYSMVANVGFSAVYWVCEQFPPLWPQLCEHPLLAALAGAVFVGIGAGLCVRVGGAPSGDDALAMSISRLARVKIQWVYFFSDMLVLGLSASYIPLSRLGWSLLTVLLSGQIIGLVQEFPARRTEL